MSERRFALVDFMHMIRVGCRRLYEAGHNYTLPRAVAHAATKRALVMSGSGVRHPAMPAAHPLYPSFPKISSGRIHAKFK
jgi:hypothetical protein